MKKSFITNVGILTADKKLLGSLAAVVVTAIVFVLYFLLSVQPSELQLSSHYTAFGQEHFYRDQWMYLLTFAGFGGMVGIVHPIIALKLYQERGRGVAVLFCWVSVALLVIAARLLYEIIKIAALSYT